MNTNERDQCIEAWRTLYYNGLLSEKEKASISKKINNKFKIKDTVRNGDSKLKS